MLPSPMRALGRRANETDSPDELHLAVITGRTKKIKQLVNKGVHIESVNSGGQTPLFCAAFGGDYEVVKVLLRLGSNPNRRCGSCGAAPIHAAAYRGSRRVLRALVDAGGDLGLRDAELCSPRDYALKQPSPLRRQKILDFFDLLLTMTLHRMAAATLPHAGTLTPIRGVMSDGGSNAGTLKSQKLKKGFFGGSQLSLSRKSSYQSTSSVWSSCVSEISSSSTLPPPDSADSSLSKEVVLTPNLHKSVSCHLVDQLCVTTSLPLLSPAQLQRPHTPTPAYTCGGPTVYSSLSWLGTPVTVRRPTPALAISKMGTLLTERDDGGSPDQDAVGSLLQELSFLRRLRHPVFLEVMAACHVTHPTPDHVILVYQHVPHGSLYHHLHSQHHDLSVGSAVDILIGLVEALLFIHAHGWFHCGLSSHALHLVSLGSAKLGGFEYAFERQVKGVGMRAEHLGRATWLRPWQAPETVVEKMVSVRSEVYSVAAIIWEMWAGMPPWAGVEEDEVSKRVSKGEGLPPLKGVSLSLVSYLTEYGLKWNAHERELDLHEVHTMLRSLRIQCNEEERVPAVTSWGPPSIPNTPVIGRHTLQSPTRLLDSSLISTSSSGESRLGDAGLVLPLGSSKGRKGWHEGMKPREGGGGLLSREDGRLKEQRGMPRPNFETGHPIVTRQFGASSPADKARSADLHKQMRKQFMASENNRDSGFSTPCSRTPSPSQDTLATTKSPTILTSTPSRSCSLMSKHDRHRANLLPNKVTHKDFITSSPPTSTPPPQVTSPKRQPPSLPRHRLSNDDENFTFVKDSVKRAFLQQKVGGDESDATASSSSSTSLASSDSVKKTSGISSPGRRRDLDVVKRGLSLSNICSSVGGCQSATVFTRTTSHISLSSKSSSSSSSGDFFGRKPPQRTISQITLTLKKLSLSSSSSSSVCSSDSQTKPGIGAADQDHQRHAFQYKLNRNSALPLENGSAKEEEERREDKKTYRYDEIVGIKPASHQLTRHSSSCSLASGPSSPAHHPAPIPLPLAASRRNRLANSHDSLHTAPHFSASSKFKTLPPPPRPLSVFTDKGSLLSEATSTSPSAKGHLRRHSDTGNSKRARRPRRRHEIEFDEEFIDDEFDASLYDQPHMQLSVGSAENLLDNRLSYSLAHDSVSSSSLSLSQHSRRLTSSEDDDDDMLKKAVTTSSSRRPLMKALEETGDSDNAENEPRSETTKPTNCKDTSDNHETCSKDKSTPTEPTSKATTENSASESEGDEDVFLKGSPPFGRKGGADEFFKEFDPLKSYKASKTLEKSLSNYLPTYSIGSDTEESVET